MIKKPTALRRKSFPCEFVSEVTDKLCDGRMILVDTTPKGVRTRCSKCNLIEIHGMPLAEYYDWVEEDVGDDEPEEIRKPRKHLMCCAKLADGQMCDGDDIVIDGWPTYTRTRCSECGLVNIASVSLSHYYEIVEKMGR